MDNFLVDHPEGIGNKANVLNDKKSDSASEERQNSLEHEYLEDYCPTDEENESIQATDGSDREEYEREDSDAERESDKEESDVDDDSPPPVMMKYFNSRNATLKHAVRCKNEDCTRSLCRRMKTNANHVSTCQNRIMFRFCPECHQTLMLCTFHALYCKLHICEVPYCNMIRREAAKKRKVRMESGS